MTEININDYSLTEQDELRAISAMMASVEKLEILSARINAEDRGSIVGEIAALKQSLEWREKFMADMVALRKIRFFA